MNTVEPVLFSWDGDGINTDDNYQSRLSNTAWSETSDFIFHQAAADLCDEISPYTLQEKYSEIVEVEIEPIKDILPLPDRHISMGSVSSRTNNVFYVRGETVIVPSRDIDGGFRLVSNNKNAARDLRSKIKNKLVEKGEQFHGAGVSEMNVYTSEEYTIENIGHPVANIDVSVEEPESFEEQILDELKPLSEAFVSNVTVNFETYSQCPEYDIIYALSPRDLIQIEVKDYSGTDDNPGENEAIHRPLRKASLLNINSTITVLRGVESNIMDELKKNSDLRKRIKIAEKDEIKDIIQHPLERSTSQGSRGPPPRRRI